MDWVLTLVGLTGFTLAGRKVWWSWYVNLFCQVLWVIYAVRTEQYGFLVSAGVYSIVFGQNALRWQIEHRQQERIKKELRKNGPVTILGEY